MAPTSTKLIYLTAQTRAAAILRTPTNYHSGSKDPAYMCYIRLSAGPVWIYPQEKNLALRFDNFGLVTTDQTLNAFAVLATVLEAARGHSDYERVYEAQTYRWGNGAPMVASFSPDSSRRLLWGDVTDTAIATQNFLAAIPCTCWVQIHVNDPAKTNLGVFLLGASTSTVSST